MSDGDECVKAYDEYAARHYGHVEVVTRRAAWRYRLAMWKRCLMWWKP